MLNDHWAHLRYTASLLSRCVMDPTAERVSMISEIVTMIEQDIARYARACDLLAFAESIERGRHRPTNGKGKG